MTRHTHTPRVISEPCAPTAAEAQIVSIPGTDPSDVGKLGEKIYSAVQRFLRLEKRRATVPRRVPVQKTTDEPIVKLAPRSENI